jgi:hypothetical protein
MLFLSSSYSELQPAEHLRAMTTRALASRHSTAIDGLQNIRKERCMALQARPDLIRFTALFQWWPLCITKWQEELG